MVVDTNLGGLITATPRAGGSELGMSFTAPLVRTVICDIDGTLANIDHRLHFVKKLSPDWDSFFSHMGDDSLNANVGDVIDALHTAGYRLIICSGRPERYRTVTEDWLAGHSVSHNMLLLRSDGDYRPDHIVKAEMLTHIRTHGFDPVIVFDDRLNVIRMWREHGLEVFQVKGHEETSFPNTAILTVMVGPTGAGKTSWLKGTVNAPPLPHELGILPWHVISTDEIRSDLTGDWMNQEKNDAVFKALHEVVLIRLSHGLPTVVDATSIRNKDRRLLVELVPTMVPVRYIIINRPLGEKRETGGWRNQLEIDLIGRHDHTFKTNLPDILAGDSFPNVTVIDLRKGIGN